MKGSVTRKVGRRRFVYIALGTAAVAGGFSAIFFASRPEQVRIVERPVEKLVERTVEKAVERVATETVTKTLTETTTSTATSTFERTGDGRDSGTPGKEPSKAESIKGTEDQPSRTSKLDETFEGWLDSFAANTFSGGPGKDGIPAIDKPKFVTPSEVDKLLSDDDVVFGTTYRGVVRAYPQIILVWHEIVNDVFDGEKACMTYCPLTGSAIGYKGRSRADGSFLTFGTTGSLVNSNLLMYDRESDSTWPQILGIGIRGPNKGNILDEFPVIFTTWGLWKKKYPQTQVLSAETGYFRGYGVDPYGSYTDRLGYYYDSQVWFPLMKSDARFHPKKVFIGVKVNNEYLAIPKDELRKARLAVASLGGESLVAIHDDSLETVRVFNSKVGDRQLSMKMDGEVMTDKETASQWDVTGKATTGALKGRQLPPANAWDVFWFAWASFYPNTKVLGIS